MGQEPARRAPRVTAGAVRADARVTARLGLGGHTHLEELRSCAPLALRPAGGSLWMVGTAAGPLPGDRVAMRIDVGAGAALTMRSTAASVALGGEGDLWSELLVDAVVGPDGELRWLPEPTVAAARCHHRNVARIRLAAGARLVWRDELVLGRYGEGPGRLANRIEIEVDGVPLLRHELRVGPGAPGWQGSAVIGGAGAVGMMVVLGPYARPAGRRQAGTSPDPEAAVLALAGGGTVLAAVAPDAHELRRRLDADSLVWTS